MNRRDFLGTGLGTLVAATSAGNNAMAPNRANAETRTRHAASKKGVISPRNVKLNLKPVMTNIIHTGLWEGPCRWSPVEVGLEKARAEERFARWSKQIREGRFVGGENVNIMEPAHLTFSEDFVLGREQADKLKPDSHEADAYFIYPAGSSIAAYEIGKRCSRPILLKGLGCRNVDIVAYSRAKGVEAFATADDAEFKTLLSLLLARKVFAGTSVLFPTDRGLPASCSVGSIWDLQGLRERLGIEVKKVSYKELAEQMELTIGNKLLAGEAEQAADALIGKADKSYLERKYVVRSFQFYQTVQSLMKRHGSNAFTIECFELCASKLADKWKITPCLIHTLHRDLGYASSCEGDLGSLLAMRLLMSVSNKSCHQGNSDPRGQGTFRINHSVPGLKMNGYDQADLPYQLGRFVKSGWGTKAVVDFMNNTEKTVTVARVNPLATKLLVCKGQLVGASGWGKDNLGCSVEALIRPPDGRADEFLKKRLEYGNHLQWVYGDYTDQLRQLGPMVGLEVEVIS